jgi:predicted permease
MLAVLGLCLPFFLLIGLGHALGRRSTWAAPALPGLNSVVMLLTLPALPFYALASLGVVATAWWLGARAGLAPRPRGLATLIAAFPNTGFMGLPLIGGLLGSAATAPVGATIVFDLVITTSLCLMLGGGTLRQGLRLAASNPLPWAVLGGIAWGLSGVALPAPLERTLALLAQATTPLALLCLGLALSQQSQHLHPSHPSHPSRPLRSPDHPGRADPSVAWGLSAVKLLLHPLLGWLGAQWALRQGWLDSASATALVLACGLPSAANVAMLAQRLKADDPAVSRTILQSTAGAVFTLPLLAWAMGVRL